MKIQSGLPNFSKPTLLLCVGNLSAEAYLAMGDEIDENFKIKVPEEHYLGKTSFNIGVNGAGSTEKDLSIHVFKDHVAKEVSEKLSEILARGIFSDLVLFIPENSKNIFQAELASEVQKSIIKVVLADVQKESPFELLARLRA
ncbi:MAG: hypothetical protein V1821_00425 [bacterium]